jgi:hypothetical protein
MHGASHANKSQCLTPSGPRVVAIEVNDRFVMQDWASHMWQHLQREPCWEPPNDNIGRRGKVESVAL